MYRLGAIAVTRAAVRRESDAIARALSRTEPDKIPLTILSHHYTTIERTLTVTHVENQRKQDTRREGVSRRGNRKEERGPVASPHVKRSPIGLRK